MSASLHSASLTTEKVSAQAALAAVAPAGVGNGKNVLRERVELRTETRKVFENTDHTLTYIIHGRPIHYRDEQGDWQDVDNSWQPSTRAGFDWEMTRCGYQAWVSNDLKARPFLLVKRGAQEWRFRAGRLQWRLGDNVLDAGNLLNPKFAKADGPALLFDTPLPNVGLRLVALPHRLSFQFEIQAGGPVAPLGDAVHLPRLDLELVQLGLAAQTDYYGETADGYIWGQSTTYSSARSTSYGVDAGATTALVGQSGGGTYYVDRAFLSFGTSGIDDGASIASATLYVCADADSSATDFLVKVYRYAWAEPLAGSNREDDFDGAYGASATLEGTLRDTASGWSSGTYYSLAVAAGGINKSGDSKYTLVSAEDVNNSAPTTAEYVAIRTTEYAGTSSDPYLSITLAVNVTVAAVVATATADGQAPSVSGKAKVAAAVATATAYGLAPSIIGKANVAAAVAVASASALAPTVGTGCSVAAAVAAATAAALEPSLHIGPLIEAPAAIATAAAPTPTIVTIRNVSIVVAVAAASADAPASAVSGKANIAAAAATATAAALAPVVSGKANVAAAVAVASADAPVPVIIAVRNVLIQPPVIAAVAAALAPELAILYVAYVDVSDQAALDLALDDAAGTSCIAQDQAAVDLTISGAAQTICTVLAGVAVNLTVDDLPGR